MALPIALFALLCLVALFFLIVGWLNIGSENGIAFIPFAGLAFLLTGAMLWTSGLELSNVTSIVDNGTSFSIVYQTISVTDGSPLWMLANALFFGGFLIILVGLGRIMQLRQTKLENEIETY